MRGTHMADKLPERAKDMVVWNKCITQQTWSFSSVGCEGDSIDSDGFSAPQFGLLHLVLNG